MIRAILLALATLFATGCVQPGARPNPPDEPVARLLVAEWRPGLTRLRLVSPGREEMVTEVADSSPYGIRFALSPTREYLTAVRLRNRGGDPGADGEVWSAQPGRPAFRYLVGGADIRSPALLSPDGATLAFRRHTLASTGAAVDELWLQPLDGGVLRRVELAPSALGLGLVGWRAEVLWYVTYHHDRSVIESTAGDALTVSGSLPIRDLRLSPDGDWIAFLAMAPGEPARVEVRSLAGDGWVIPTGLPYAGLAWTPAGSLSLSLTGSQVVPPDLPFALVPLRSSGQTIDLPVSWSPNGAWLAARRLTLSSDGRPIAEQLGLLGRDQVFRAIEGEALPEAIGWVTW